MKPEGTFFVKILRALVSKPQRRGSSILLLSMICLMLMLLISATLYNLLPVEMHAANRNYMDSQGHYVARAGIQETMAWLETKMEKFQATGKEEDLPDYKQGSSFTSIDDFVAKANARRPFENKGWSYKLELTPFQDQLSDFNNLDPKLFSLRSTSYFDGRPVRTVDVLLKQKTFAMFALLNSDSENKMNMLVTNEPSFMGPVHTNSYYAFIANHFQWDRETHNSKDAFFQDVVTHSKTFDSAPVYGDNNEWVGGAPYDENGPKNNRYNEVFKNGRNDLRLKNHIDLPTNTDNILAQTYPDTLPTTQGVHLFNDAGKVKGGVYVKGNVTRMQMALDVHGNQQINVMQQSTGKTTTTVNENSRHNHTSACPRTTRRVEPDPYQVQDGCKEWNPVPPGSVGGIGGGSVTPTCKVWNYRWVYPSPYNTTVYSCGNLPLNADSSSSTTTYEPTETSVYEVTENAVSLAGLVNEAGESVPAAAAVGQTLVVNKRYSQAAKKWVVDDVQVLDGQINGSIYVDGNIGENHDYSARTWQNANYDGLYGIIKGSALVDETGSLLKNSDGGTAYVNKTITTSLDNKYIALGGDLLQFNQKRFNEYKAANSANMKLDQRSGNVYNWTKVATDPHATNEKERYSPDNQHILGLISHDVWMIGRKDNSNTPLNNGNRINEVYAVILAGKTLANGKVSGGFGTYKNLRDQLSDRLGEYVIYGGVVQGTSKDREWVDGSGNVGYDVKLNYDINATRQQMFPALADFQIIRYFERAARDSG